MSLESCTCGRMVSLESRTCGRMVSLESRTCGRMVSLESRTCGKMVSFDLRSCSPMSDALRPSITMLPPAASVRRNNATVMDDFPAPVLPTIPI